MTYYEKNGIKEVLTKTVIELNLLKEGTEGSSDCRIDITEKEK